MTVKIQLRRGTAAEWTSANPTLLSGEQGLETDTGKTKIGDGVTAWNSLGYAFVPNSLFANKGTIAAASAASTPAALSVGSNGQMLMADSSATAGLRYVDPPANRNLIINGAMQVHQRGTSNTGMTSGGYFTADRWRPTLQNMGTWTETLENDAPTGTGFIKSWKILCTTADASPAGSDFVSVAQRLEGQDLQRIRKGTSDARELTLSFWAKSNVTGTYICALRDNDNSRSVSAAYTISASNTWEKKEVSFPADTTGALDNDGDYSLEVTWFLGAGSNRTSGTLNTLWESLTNANRAVGQTNLAAATNNYWQVTGVQLETGPVATPFEFEPYEATLRKCQRYYYLHVSGTDRTIAGGHYDGASQVVAAVDFPTTMRTAPSLTVATGTNYYRMTVDNSTNDDFNSLTVTYASDNTAIIYNNSEVSGTTGKAGYLLTKNASSSIAFSAEL